MQGLNPKLTAPMCLLQKSSYFYYASQGQVTADYVQQQSWWQIKNAYKLTSIPKMQVLFCSDHTLFF